MPDDHDRRELDDLERRLAADDPGFVARFQREQERLPAPPGCALAARIAVTVAVTAGLLLLLAGSPVGALAAVVATALVWGTWRFPVPPAGDADRSRDDGHGHPHGFPFA